MRRRLHPERLLWLIVILTVAAAAAGQVRRRSARGTAPPAAPARAERAAAAALESAQVHLQRDAAGNARWIEAPRGEVDDAALAQIAKLHSLEWLELAGSGITPAGLGKLGASGALRRLYLHDVNLHGQDPKWLSGLKRLEALSLQRTGASGDTLRYLPATLRVLNLSGTRVGDEDMVEVARMKNLEVLALQDTAVTGAGLSRLRGLQKLNVLNLANCRIGDADLKVFASMPNLRIVFAAGSRIGEGAVAGMREQFPMLSIFR